MTDIMQSKKSRPSKKAPAKAQTHESVGRPSKEPRTPETKPESKTQKVMALLQRPDGATLDELVAATSWQPHTTRAALTGLKKKGHVITSEKADGVRRYLLGAA